MSDTRRRERERDAARDDDLAAATRALVERLRAGELTTARLRVAAHAGHAAARGALGQDAPALLAASLPGADRDAWAMGLALERLKRWETLGEEVPLRATLALARRALAELTPLPPDDGAAMARALDAASAWRLGDALAPSDAAIEAAWPLCERNETTGVVRYARPPGLAGQPSLEFLVFVASTAPPQLSCADPEDRKWILCPGVELALHSWPADEVVSTISRGLVTWALGL